MNRDNWKGTGNRQTMRLALLAVSMSMSAAALSDQSAFAQTALGVPSGFAAEASKARQPQARPRRLPPVAESNSAVQDVRRPTRRPKSVQQAEAIPETFEDLPLPAPPEPRAIVAAARRQSKWMESQSEAAPDLPDQWLQSITTSSCATRAARLVDDAYREYSVGAWASAEASAWKALELLATGVDVADRQTAPADTPVTAAGDLQSAHDAIMESRDFLIQGAAVDRDLMIGIAASHRTPVFASGLAPTMTPTEAVDRYLDFARIKLAPLASYQVQAAQAMDLIAAIGLGRNDAKTLPEETALCLRRAALQGQPTNASLASRLGIQLADMGLDDEARWTLSHALSLSPSRDVAQTLSVVVNRLGDRQAAMRLTASLRQQMPEDAADQSPRKRMPTIVELSPAQFASISKPAIANLPPANSTGVVDPATSVTSRLGEIEQPETQLQTGLGRKSSRFTPASLAGFRTGSSNEASISQTTPTGTTQRSSGQVRSDSAGNAAAASAERPSRLKALMGKLPKIW